MEASPVWIRGLSEQRFMRKAPIGVSCLFREKVTNEMPWQLMDSGTRQLAMLPVKAPTAADFRGDQLVGG